ncbi:hypothetical protein [Streptomyces sp. NPDC089919]|uniref:hypothetical protein n=1 Tax=Streptomyces sp. NPDC089919 TaxID=3155188 RepID=UPI003433D59D
MSAGTRSKQDPAAAAAPFPHLPRQSQLPPLTSEPPLAAAAPLTSEPPLADEAPLTSEPTALGAASDSGPTGV